MFTFSFVYQMKLSSHADKRKNINLKGVSNWKRFVLEQSHDHMTNNDNRVTGGLVIVTSERGGYIGQTDERDIYLYVRRNLFCFSKSKKKKEDDEHFR